MSVSSVALRVDSAPPAPPAPPTAPARPPRGPKTSTLILPFKRVPAAKPDLEIVFRIRPEHAAAFKAALDELGTKIGGRLEGSRKFSEEDALTYAAAALGSLRAAVYAAAPGAPSADYIW